MNKEVSPLIQLWQGPHLPPEHVFIDPTNRPKEVDKLLRLYFRKWFVHPLKRHSAHWYLKCLQATGTQVVGITGSAGKTTTKEMVASVLEESGMTKKSPGNIDPVYNIPQTILSSRFGLKWLVLEMGIEFPGEMEYYTWLARPDVSIVTNITTTHTQYLHSIEGVANQKGKIVESLSQSGHAILNYDDPRVLSMKDRTSGKVVTYGLDKKADIQGLEPHISLDLRTVFRIFYGGKSIEVELPLAGLHFINLALAAAAVGILAGLDLPAIKRGLEKTPLSDHRMTPFHLKDGRLLIDDTYNSNPLAAKAAVQLLNDIPSGGKRILVLADMKELGQYEESGHREIGSFVAEKGIDNLILFGNLVRYISDEAIVRGMKKSQVDLMATREEVAEKIIKILKPGDVVLIKGSRSMKMDEVVKSVLLKYKSA